MKPRASRHENGARLNIIRIDPTFHLSRGSVLGHIHGVVKLKKRITGITAPKVRPEASELPRLHIEACVCRLLGFGACPEPEPCAERADKSGAGEVKAGERD